jgi:DNA-binding MarR family transcriptional regulator
MSAAQPRQPTLIQDLAQALSRAERRVVRQVARALAADACTIEQWRTLVLLSDGHGHPMTQIAEFALVPAPSLTRLIDRMVTDGLVHRTVDPADRRRVLVHTTPHGRALHRRLAARIEREHGHVLGVAETAEAQRLLALLSTLFDGLS